MQDHAAVFRDGPVLKQGFDKMISIFQEFGNVKVFDKYRVTHYYKMI